MTVKVAIVTESFLPRVNGVTNSVCRVLEHLRRSGMDGMVISPAPGPTEYAGFEVRTVPGFALPKYRSFVLGVPTLKVEEHLRDYQPDVVHLASPFLLGASGAAAARRLDIPSVAVFQTDVAGFVRRNGIRGTDRLIWRWLRKVHQQADLTLAPSTATVDQLADHGIPRVQLWRRGVDLERFTPRHRDEELRRRLAPNGEVLVGYVGRLSADKRPHLLAHLADLPGVQLVVVGDGPAEAQTRQQLPGAHFLGFQTGQQLSRTLASLDVFVHLGADETFCQAIQEALAAGVPVVAPAAGGPLDLVEHGATGFLYPPESVTGLRSAVNRLVREPATRTRFGHQARRSVQGRTWEAVCDQLLGYYAQARAVAGHGAALPTWYPTGLDRARLTQPTESTPAWRR